MPAVDRAILRLGTFELLWRDDVPDAVVDHQAVELARSLSTDDSPAFVNGLLGRLLELKPTLAWPCPAGRLAEAARLELAGDAQPGGQSERPRGGRRR